MNNQSTLEEYCILAGQFAHPTLDMQRQGTGWWYKQIMSLPRKYSLKKTKTTTTICSIKKKHYYFLRDQSIQTLLGDFPAQRICQLSKSLKATFGSLCFWSNINTSYLKLRYFPLTVVLSDHRPPPPTTTVGVLSPQTHSGAVKSCSGSSWVVRTRAALESISHRSKKFRSCGNSKHGWRAIFLFIYLFIFPPSGQCTDAGHSV